MLSHVLRRVVCFGVFLALTIFCFSRSVHAASLPASQDVFVTPGEGATVSLPVTNAKAVPVNLSFSLFSADVLPGNDDPVLRPLSAELAAWISLSSSSLALDAGTTKTITLSLSPPVTMSPQTIGIAVAETETLSGDIPLSHGSATLVFLTIGDAKPTAVCLSFVRESSGFGTVSFVNSGRGILYENGAIVLRGIFGIRFGTTVSNPLFHRVLPGQTRAWQVSLPPIPLWAVGSLSYSIEDAQLGTYQCEPLNVGTRWWPIVVAFFGVCGGFVLFFRRQRA